MSTDMVSVIIPNYNHASFLRQRIDSILNQTFQNFELIILDDCSTDNSKEIIEQYRTHPKVSRIVYNKTNSGSVFKQWEKGIGYSKGDYVLIAESDDYAEPTLLKTLYEAIISQPEIGLAYCDSYIVDENGKRDNKTFSTFRKEILGLSKWEKSYVNNGREEIKENLLEWCTVNNASAVLFRKSVLETIQPFDLGFKYIGDWYLYLKICNEYNIAFISEPLSNYRDHSANTFKKSKSYTSYVQEYFVIFNWIFKTMHYYNRKKMTRQFLKCTRHALLKNLDKNGRQMYRKLVSVNPALFFKMIVYNITCPIRERLGINS